MHYQFADKDDMTLYKHIMMKQSFEVLYQSYTLTNKFFFKLCTC